MYYKATYSSPLGEITLAADSESLIGLWIYGQKYYAGLIEDELTENHSLPIFNMTRNWLDNYFNGGKPEIYNLPLSPIGSDFRQSVWHELCEIPYGKITTYGDIAKRIAKQTGKTNMSAQAIGGAVGHNPISIIIPCHRVVGSNGSLTGYAGGIDKKIKLLELEKVDMTPFFVPKHGTAL